MMKWAGAAAAVLMLAGCVPPAAQTQAPGQTSGGAYDAAATALGAYDAAVAAELTYLNLPTADPAVARQMEADRIAAWALVKPLADAAAAGNAAPAAAAVTAAQAAIDVMNAYLTAHGVVVKGAAQ
ncbi:MAG: hypothetical protein KGH75_00945 [Rhodospirillales bacterium]|nr:hypothetical protein [Rhodospirillales bacterium]